MKYAIRYYTKTGNAKKVAEAVGKVLNTEALPVTAPLNEKVDYLFLASSVYGAGIDEEVKKFISNLKKEQVGKVVNLSTAALLPSTYKQVKKLVRAKGIVMDEREFHCRGKFQMMHKDRPNAKDLIEAETFAKNFL
jgi:flavodoxin